LLEWREVPPKDVIMDYLLVFLFVFFTDIFYTQYLKSVQDNKILKASIWAGVVTLLPSIAVLLYVENHYTLIASILGAGCGTMVGMRFKKPNEVN
jgi:uncharacterized membrane protein YczE